MRRGGQNGAGARRGQDRGAIGARSGFEGGGPPGGPGRRGAARERVAARGRDAHERVVPRVGIREPARRGQK